MIRDFAFVELYHATTPAERIAIPYYGTRGCAYYPNAGLSANEYFVLQRIDGVTACLSAEHCVPSGYYLYVFNFFIFTNPLVTDFIPGFVNTVNGGPPCNATVLGWTDLGGPRWDIESYFDFDAEAGVIQAHNHMANGMNQQHDWTLPNYTYVPPSGTDELGGSGPVGTENGINVWRGDTRRRRYYGDIENRKIRV